MPEKRITLPETKDGYYRFGDLPRLIADSDLPQQWPDDDSEGMNLALGELRTIEAMETRLQAAVENENLPAVDFAYQPLEWAQGAALDSALVHIDWLNEWGAHQSIAYVFTIATPETPQKETPKQRRAQLLQELEAEEKQGKRGALQRLADRLGVDRSNLGKNIEKARDERNNHRRAGGWASQLVQDGKRTR